MPESVPLAGFVPIATVTDAVLAVRLPPASRMRTVTAGVIDAAGATLIGCVPNASFAAAPTVMLKAIELPASGQAAGAEVSV